MSKDEFAQILRDAGYDAENRDGVVMVKATQDNRRRIWREVRQKAREASFDASVGISISNS